LKRLEKEKEELCVGLGRSVKRVERKRKKKRGWSECACNANFSSSIQQQLPFVLCCAVCDRWNKPEKRLYVCSCLFFFFFFFFRLYPQ
jgi:hypothetical protein